MYSYLVSLLFYECTYIYIVSLIYCAGVTDARGRTPLDLAMGRGHTETIDYIQSIGAPSAAPSTDYRSPSYPPVDQQPQGIIPYIAFKFRIASFRIDR